MYLKRANLQNPKYEIEICGIVGLKFGIVVASSELPCHPTTLPRILKVAWHKGKWEVHIPTLFDPCAQSVGDKAQ